jgi:endonuclease-3
MLRLRLQEVIDELRAIYGVLDPPLTTDPFEMVLLENVAYLVSDEQRAKAFQMLKEKVGTRPAQILAARPETLFEVARLGGMRPEARVEKLRTIAAIAAAEFASDLKSICGQALTKARKSLKRFPSIGDPGADRILLFSRSHYLFPLDSNGLRVLVRVGFAEEHKDYSATYRAVQRAIAAEIEPDWDWLIEAHQLLRHHGKVLCKTASPMCVSCGLARVCEHASGR